MVPESSELLTSDEYHKPIDWWTFCLNLYFFLSLICLTADLVLITAIVRYSRLLNRKSNMVILHWTICDATFQALHPTIFRVSIKGTSQYWYHEIVCSVEKFCYMLLLVQILFVVLLTFYWYYDVHDSVKLIKISNQMTSWIIFVYCVGLFSTGFQVWSCVTDFQMGYTSFLFSILGFLVFSLFMLIINIASIIRRKLNNTSGPFGDVNFILGNLFFLSKFSAMVIMHVSYFLRFHSNAFTVAFFFAVSNSIFNLIILYIRDEDYKGVLNNIFTLNCGRCNEEFVDEPIMFSNGGVQSRS